MTGPALKGVASAYVALARAHAEFLTLGGTDGIEQALAVLAAVEPEADDLQINRGATLASLEALCGGDPDRWEDLLVWIVLREPGEIIKACGTVSKAEPVEIAASHAPELFEASDGHD